jgi:hypothetical protein
MVRLGTYSGCAYTCPSTGYDTRLPKSVTLTFDWFRIVSLEYCPSRELSFLYVVTAVLVDAACAAGAAKRSLWDCAGRWSYLVHLASFDARRTAARLLFQRRHVQEAIAVQADGADGSAALGLLMSTRC